MHSRCAAAIGGGFYLKALFSNRNFKIHWMSGAIAQTGNFFTIVALPWLVLSITNDNAVLMATVLAMVALPQGLFILFGGAIVDRISPYKTIVASRLLLCFLMATLAIFVYLNIVPLWLIYLYAFSLGCLGAIGLPAAQSMLPSIVKAEHLGQANGIVIGTLYLAQVAGPVLAGWLMWLGGQSETENSLRGISLAFSVDAAAMLIALLLFQLIRSTPQKPVNQSVVQLLSAGLKFCWRDEGIRLVLTYIVLVSFFVHGPITAGLPMLAKAKLILSEAQYGTLYAMLGLGTVLGAGLAMAFNPNPGILGTVVLVSDGIVGSCLALLGIADNIYLASAFILIMGISGGVVMTAGTTWFQRRTPDEYMGRVMSVLMFAVIGLIPASATLSGYIMETGSVTHLMLGTGLTVVAISVAGLLVPRVRNMGVIDPPAHFPIAKAQAAQ